jgi:hypothetical protein
MPKRLPFKYAYPVCGVNYVIVILFLSAPTDPDQNGTFTRMRPPRTGEANDRLSNTYTEIPMRKSIFLTAALAALMMTVPASAQVFFSDDPAAGDGSEAAAVPGYGGHRYRVFVPGRYFGFTMTCRVAYLHQVMPHGQVVTTAHRSCY